MLVQNLDRIIVDGSFEIDVNDAQISDFRMTSSYGQRPGSSGSFIISIAPLLDVAFFLGEIMPDTTFFHLKLDTFIEKKVPIIYTFLATCKRYSKSDSISSIEAKSTTNTFSYGSKSIYIRLFYICAIRTFACQI
jgi:hypothetical protein